MRSVKDILEKTKYMPHEMELFLAECMVDYLYFAEHVLGFDIAEYHKEWYKFAERFPRLSITAFRGSGKTHFFSGYFLWKAIFNPKTEYLIISNLLEQAKLILKIIRSLVVENEVLKQFVPQNREGSWKATELNLVNGSVFYCKPYGEGVRSIHPDYVLCDEAGEYEDKSIFWTAVLGTIQLKQGRVIVIGTPKSSVDLLSELKENDEYFCKEYPAEVNGKPLWPQKYTTKPVDEFGKRSLTKIRREMGELPYTQEYMLIPISSANSLFPYELTTKAVDNSLGFLPYGRKNGKYYIGYDMAISPKGDWTVMTVIEANNDGKIVVEVQRFRDSFDEQKRRLSRLYEDFKPNKILIDSTGLGDIPVRELQEKFDCVEAIKFTYDEKYKMLMDLRQEFERFNITLPNLKDDRAYTYTQQLLKELNDFSIKTDLRIGSRQKLKFHSGKTDDCVISLALANRAAQSTSGNVSLTTF